MLQSKDEKKRLESDAFAKLENTEKDSQIARVKQHGVESILASNERTWSDPYTLSISSQIIVVCFTHQIQIAPCARGYGVKSA